MDLFSLRGDFRGDDILLAEMDSNGRLIGSLHLSLLDRSLSGSFLPIYKLAFLLSFLKASGLGEAILPYAPGHEIRCGQHLPEFIWDYGFAP